MENNRFETPVTVKSVTAGSTQLLRTAREASEYLLNSWPGKRSPKHRAALQACHDALAGDKPAMNARRERPLISALNACPPCAAAHRFPRPIERQPDTSDCSHARTMQI